MARIKNTSGITKNGNKKVEGYTSTMKKNWISKEARLAIYIRDNFQCLYCGMDLRNIDRAYKIQLDHLLPRVAGGTDNADNLITACCWCNGTRQDKSWMDYATGGAIERIQTQRVKPINIDLAMALINGTTGNPETESAR